MRIFFGTNRNPTDTTHPTDFGNTFSQNGLTDLRFGWATVPENGLSGYTLTVAGEFLDVGLANAHRNDFTGQKLGSTEVFTAVRDEMRASGKDCIISIHGFNYTFAEAIQRTAQLADFYKKTNAVFFLFTWPSDGSMLPFKAYMSDRDDARASGAALGRGLQKLASFLHAMGTDAYCNQKVHLFAHSMGNYALRWAVQGIRKSAGSSLRRLFDQVVLFAADEDDDAFEHDHKLAALPAMCRHVTVYHNAGDAALVISDATKGNPDRLGASGPRNSRLLPNKVSVVDCEPVIAFDDDPTGHQYYRLNTTVRKDVLSVLRGTGPSDIPSRRYINERNGYKLKRPKDSFPSS